MIFLGIPIFPISTPRPEDPVAGDIKGKYPLLWFNFSGNVVLHIIFLLPMPATLPRFKWSFLDPGGCLAGVSRLSSPPPIILYASLSFA